VRSPSALAAALVALAAGCGGGSPPEAAAPAETRTTLDSAPTNPTPSTTAPPPTPTEPEPLSGLSAFTAGYDGWLKLNRKPIPPRQSGDAHSGTKNVYASKKRRASGSFPNGTILVKEAVRPGKDFIGLIAIMRKERGVDGAHNDWRFVEYTRDSARARFTETASDSVCWSCHMGAQQTDYAWIYTLGLGR
jgi:cytochrome P460